MAHKRIYKVYMYDANRVLLLTIRVHAEYYYLAGKVAIERNPDLKTAFTSVRIR